MEANVDEILSRYPLASGQCSQCAREVYALFTEQGLVAQIGHIETDLPFLTLADGTYVAHRPRGSDSLAFHEFVKVGDFVYDAITGPNGMFWDEYQSLFYEGVFTDGTIRLTYHQP